MKSAPANGYEDWYLIRTHEIDYRKSLTCPALMMLMQEASMHNALELKISIWDKGMDNLSWVLLRKDIIINKSPTIGDKIKVVTYPAGFEKIFAYRDFWVFDSAGNVIATASSTWTLMNLETRKINRIPSEILALDLPDKEERLARPDIRLPKSLEMKESYSYRIRHYDLDWNHHVNNIVLSRLMLQAIDESCYESRQLKRFTIHIKSECFYNDDVLVYIEKVNDSNYNHEIRGKDGRIIAGAHSIWGE